MEVVVQLVLNIMMAGLWAQWTVGGVQDAGVAPMRTPEAGAAVQSSDPATRPTVAQPVAPASISTAEELLAALETADAGLTTLTARILYDKVFELQGDRQKWQGELYFESRTGDGAEASARRRFGVHFTQSQIGSAWRPEDMRVIFDGRWFIEARPSIRQIIRREVVREGDARVDPMRLGDTPITLPIGQKRQDILDRFDVTLLGPDEGLVPHESSEMEAMRTFVKDCKQLLLRPKSGFAGVDGVAMEEIRLWYMPVTQEDGSVRWLPRLARNQTAESASFVQLIGVVVNGELPEGALDAGTPADTTGWDVREERLPAGPAPAR